MIATIVQSPTPAISQTASRVEKTEPKMVAVGTMILWLLCVTVGTLGMVLQYTRPVAPQKEAPPIQAEILNVELTQDPLPPPDVQPPTSVSQPPTLIPLPAPQQAPPMVAVAAPSPAIAFALPVEGPTRVVEARQASYVKPTVPTQAVAATAPVQPLTFGQGEGKQPAPEYPARASRAGQEGTVLVRFTVGENGRVLAAEAASPSPWSLLNESAVRTVRERWRFSPGIVRLYEVAIRFQLTK